MSYWGWKNPYKNSAKANLLSMLIAIPLGIIVCIIGSIILNLEEKYLRALPSDVSFQLAQIFLFGQISTYNFGFAIEEWMTNDGVVLAAVLYMGICLAFTIWVEGNYHARKNPEIGRKNIFMRTTIIHFCSYMVLLMAWLPYSYYSAKNKEDALKVLCSKNNAGRYECEKIWSKFPEIYRSSINYNYLNP